MWGFGVGVLGFWAWDEVRGRIVTDLTYAKLKESIVKYYHGDCFGTGQLFQPYNNETIYTYLNHEDYYFKYPRPIQQTCQHHKQLLGNETE